MSDQPAPSSMIFSCPTCGAPLTPPEDGYPSLQCKFCKNTVIVPPELRRPARFDDGDHPDSAAIKAATHVEIMQFLASGNKIEAIKRYRQVYGVGLKEAKDAVDALEVGRPVDFPDPVPPVIFRQPPESLADIAALARQGQVLEAIKLYQQRFDVGLKEAKDAVDALISGNWEDARQAAASSQRAIGQAQQLIAITQLARSGNKIEAIKLYRETFDVGLKEAKDAVEALEAGRPVAAVSTSSAVTIQSTPTTRVQPQAAGKIAGCMVFIVIVSVLLPLIIGAGVLLFTFGGAANLPEIVQPIAEAVRPTPILSGPAALIPPGAGQPDGQTDFIVMTYHPQEDTRTLARLSAAAGKILWETAPLNKDISYLELLAADLQHVYAIREDRLTVYNLNDGSLAWQTTLADRLGYCGQLDCVLPFGSRLLVVTTDGTLQAYDPQTGAPVWNRRAENAPRGLHPVGQQVAFIEADANNDYSAVFVNPASGEEVQRITPQCKTGSWDEGLGMDSPMIYDGKDSLYFIYGWHPGCVEKWRLAAGGAELLWQTASEEGYFGASEAYPLLTEQALYFRDREELRVADLQSGELKVLAQVEDYDLLPLASSGDLVLVRARRTRGSERFELWGLEAASGNRRWQIGLGDAGPLDPPNEMHGLVSDKDAWTWRWFAGGASPQLILVKAQADPNQLVIETYDGAAGTLLNTTTVPLQWFSSDFYTIPEPLGWRGRVLWLSISPGIYALDVEQGKLIFGGP